MAFTGYLDYPMTIIFKIQNISVLSAFLSVNCAYRPWCRSDELGDLDTFHSPDVSSDETPCTRFPTCHPYYACGPLHRPVVLTHALHIL